jgi:hypothetical protein
VATYGDAPNIGAASRAGGGFTPEDARHKFEVLERRCAEVGRDPRSILRTSIVGPCFLPKLKKPLAPSWTDSSRGSSPVARDFRAGGTDLRRNPGERREVRAGLLDAGHQYLIYPALESDPETLELLSDRVMPAVQAASVET